MCYPKPGPRCSYHAKRQVHLARQELSRASEALDTAVALDNDVDQFQRDHAEAVAEYNTVMRSYYTTPAGFKALSRKIEQARTEGKPEKFISRMQEKLDHLKDERQKSIAALGGEAHEETDEDTQVGEDFSRCDQCGQFVGSSHNCQLTGTSETQEYDENNIQTWQPQQVDEKLSELFNEQYQVMDKLLVNKRYIDGNEKIIREATYNTDYIQRSNDRLKAEREELQDKLSQLQAESAKYEHEYERRGHWTRAFIVTNANGHVHRNMECSTCRPTTRFAWLPSYSGKDESGLVADAGERACTQCYPSAPVETRNAPTRIFTPQERDQQQARQEREQARQQREQTRQQKAITTPDGRPLKLSGRFGESIASEATARSRYVEIVARERLIEEGVISRDYVSSSDTEDRAILSEALQAKNQMNAEEYDSSIESKIVSKTRSMRREWTRG